MILNNVTQGKTLPHGMCYSHLGNRVFNGAVSIMQRGFISCCYKVKSIGQWGKSLAMAMGWVTNLFADIILEWSLTANTLPPTPSCHLGQ